MKRGEGGVMMGGWCCEGGGGGGGKAAANGKVGVASRGGQGLEY